MKVNTFLMELFQAKKPAPVPPADLLAREEALLDYCESNDMAGFLSFWESATYFIVLGYSRAVEREVFRSESAGLNIPILRRSSGGGTVLQGPGCFNYSLVLPIDAAPELETITGANRYIMEKMRATLEPLAGGTLEVRGHTDLTLDGLKFSGNAQRRKRRSVLFHGSFLLNFDLSLISKTLRLPPQQPDYRQNRPHESFLTNLKVASVRIETALVEGWNAKNNAPAAVEEKIAVQTKDLAAAKYSRDEWNLRL